MPVTGGRFLPQGVAPLTPLAKFGQSPRHVATRPTVSFIADLRPCVLDYRVPSRHHAAIEIKKA